MCFEGRILQWGGDRVNCHVCTLPVLFSDRVRQEKGDVCEEEIRESPQEGWNNTCSLAENDISSLLNF